MKKITIKYCVCVLLVLFLTTCKKDSVNSNICKFKVIDDHTKLPIIGCKAVLVRNTDYGHTDYFSIGYTDANGYIDYNFIPEDKYQINYIEFSDSTYFPQDYYLQQTSNTSENIIQCNRQTTLGIRARLVTPPNGYTYESWILYYSSYECGHCTLDFDATQTNHPIYIYEKVPSNNPVTISWIVHHYYGINLSSDSQLFTGSVLTHSNYTDTTYFNIDF